MTSLPYQTRAGCPQHSNLLLNLPLEKLASCTFWFFSCLTLSPSLHRHMSSCLRAPSKLPQLDLGSGSNPSHSSKWRPVRMSRTHTQCSLQKTCFQNFFIDTYIRKSALILTVQLTDFLQIECAHETSMRIMKQSLSGVPEALLITPFQPLPPEG